MRLQSARSDHARLVSGIDPRQIGYWLHAVELWARSYSQYIAARADNRELKADLNVARELENIELYRNVQWEGKDFDPIAGAIDLALEALRWRNG